MATKYWLGTATAVQQVDTITVGGTLAGETFSILVNGKVVATYVDTDNTPATVATNLISAWNDSDSPYTTPITADSPGSGQVRLTSDVAGFPFTVTLNTPGGSATFSLVNTTASVSPHDWNEATNWSDGAVPGGGDTVIFRDSGIDVCWGLDQSMVTLQKLIVERSFTGRIGLRTNQVAISLDGRTTSESEPEYRDTYLEIGWTECELGDGRVQGGPSGSQRLKLNNNKAGVSQTIVFETGSQSAETGLPSVRLLFANSGADVFVRRANSGVGIAVDTPGETATVGTVRVAQAAGIRGRVVIGDGTTLNRFEQDSASCTLRAAATITEVVVSGGELSIEGQMSVTTLRVEGGVVYPNNRTTGTDITTVNILGGVVNGRRSNGARTWGTVTVEPGGELVGDTDFLTISTLNPPTQKRYSLKAS